MRVISCLYAVITALTISGCLYTTPEDVLKGQGHRTATLSVREHVFASQPLWESSLVKPKKVLPSKMEPKIDDLKINDLGTIAPGLAALRDRAEGKTPPPFKIAGEAGAQVTITTDELPPPSLASTPVMKAFIDAMTAEVIGEYRLRHGQKINEETKNLIDRTLTFQDFWDFRAEVAKTAAAVFQDTPDATKRRSSTLDCPNDGKVRWYCLFLGYFTRYYHGKFVDRDGGVLSKPKIGFAITNETITGLATTVLEAVYDWTVVTSQLKIPVVYTGTITNPAWQTPNTSKPTFAEVLLSMYPAPQDIKPFIEPASNGTQPGISRLKLCGIRLVSGLAADAAQPLAGAIIRLFGGAEAGPFVVFGKFSFGDNETIARLVDTYVEVTARRVTAGAASQLIYDVPDNELPDLILKGLNFLADCK